MAPRVRKKRSATGEDAIQRAVFQHLRARGAPGIVAFHPKNGGVHMRGRRAGVNIGLGVLAGVPDVIVVAPINPGTLCGQTYALELKTEAGILSDEQRDVLQRLKTAGAIVGVAHGLDDALRQLQGWGLLKGVAA